MGEGDRRRGRDDRVYVISARDNLQGLATAGGHVRINQHLHCNTRRGNHYDCDRRGEFSDLIARVVSKSLRASPRVQYTYQQTRERVSPCSVDRNH